MIQPWNSAGHLAPLLLAFTLLSCVARKTTVRSTGPDPAAPPVPPRTLDVVTFNVAGLPHWIGKTDGRETHPMIGPALEPFDLVLLQEDSWYHDLLSAPHPWQAHPRSGGFIRLGDGLARMSHLPLSDVVHVPWKAAHGLFGAYHDRWALKGFSAGRMNIDEARSIWVYNVHFDAGGGEGDREARELQREQLLADILERTSPQEALIVAGDFNAGHTDLLELIEGAALLDCNVGWIDRILIRSGTYVGLGLEEDSSRPAPDLSALSGLSDHSASWVRLGIELR